MKSTKKLLMALAIFAGIQQITFAKSKSNDPQPTPVLTTSQKSNVEADGKAKASSQGTQSTLGKA